MVVWVHEYSIMLLYVFVCHDVMSSLKATVSWEVWQCQLSQNKEEDDIPAEIYASVHLCCCVCVCVRVHVSKTEIEDIIYSLSGRAFVCQEGLYCQLCQNNRIGDIPTEVFVCLCLCAWEYECDYLSVAYCDSQAFVKFYLNLAIWL